MVPTYGIRDKFHDRHWQVTVMDLLKCTTFLDAFCLKFQHRSDRYGDALVRQICTFQGPFPMWGRVIVQDVANILHLVSPLCY